MTPADIRVIRAKLDWTQERLAEAIGVTPQTIRNMEKQRTPISQSNALAIEAVYDREANDQA